MDDLSKHLADHQFAELFRDDLGWNQTSGTMAIQVDERELALESIAEKRGIHVFQCIADRGLLANRASLREAQGRIARTIQEHILIYSCDEPSQQTWQWTVRAPDGTRLERGEHHFFSSAPPRALLRRLRRLRISLKKDGDVTLVNSLYPARAPGDAAPELHPPSKSTRYAERSRELAMAMARGDAGAFHAFVLLHLPFVRSTSKRLSRSLRMEIEDTAQIAVIGLMSAIRRFDPQRGTCFSTYARFWVHQVCQRYAPAVGMHIRLPRHIIHTFFPIRRAIDTLRAAHGPGRANDELARLCALAPQFYSRWVDVDRALNVISLSDRYRWDPDETLELRGPEEDEPVPLALEKERNARVRAAMACLNRTDRTILEQRYGMNGKPLSNRQLGQSRRITEVAARCRVLRRAETASGHRGQVRRPHPGEGSKDAAVALGEQKKGSKTEETDLSRSKFVMSPIRVDNGSVERTYPRSGGLRSRNRPASDQRIID